MSDEGVTFGEFARILRVKPSYVTQLRKDGRLALSPDGKRVRVDESRKLIAATRDPSKAGVAARHASARAPEPPNDLDDDMDDPSSSTGADEPLSSPFHSHRAERERWLAATARQNYEKSIGKLLDADQAAASVAQAGSIFRKAMERLPSALAPQLVGLSERAIQDRIETEIDPALRELQRALTEACKGGDTE